MNLNNIDNKINEENNNDFVYETNTEKNTSKDYSEAKKYNRKIYPIYKMLSWDLLFYYSIIFLFLTTQKGLSASQVLLVDSFYPLFKGFTNLPCLALTDKIGRRKSIVIGNLLVTISILVVILSGRLRYLILANFLCAFGYSLKNLSESTLLHDCIEIGKHSNSQFAKINGKGSAFYYVFDAISTALTGFLYIYNAYLPLFLCMIFCIISTIISYTFEDYTDPKIQKQKNSTPDYNYISELISSFKFIFNSKRLRALLIFTGLFSGLLQIRSSISSSLLKDIGLPNQYFGIVFALLQIAACIASVRQNYYHKKYRNRLLTHFSLKYTLSIILLAIVIILKLPFIPTLILFFIFQIMQHNVKGPYYVLIQKYLNSFSTPEISTKIYTVSSILESLIGSILAFLASVLLARTTTAYTTLIIGIGMLVIFLFVLDYMKPRFGLKPEEYDKKDIEYVSPNKLLENKKAD